MTFAKWPEYFVIYLHADRTFCRKGDRKSGRKHMCIRWALDPSQYVWAHIMSAKISEKYIWGLARPPCENPGSATVNYCLAESLCPTAERRSMYGSPQYHMVVHCTEGCPCMDPHVWWSLYGSQCPANRMTDTSDYSKYYLSPSSGYAPSYSRLVVTQDSGCTYK